MVMEEKTVKKSTPGQIFLKGFIRSMIFIAAFCAVAFISYLITYRMYDTGKLELDATKSILGNQSGKKEHVTVCRNLIYEVNAKDGTIQAMVLEIYDTQAQTLDYITIPRILTVSLSTDLFRRISTVNPDVPQNVMIKHLVNYFKDTSSYEYGEIFIGDAFGTDITYYTALSRKHFQKIFKRNAEGTFIFRKGMQNKLSSLTDEKELRTFMTKMYQRCSTDCNLASRAAYVSDYQGLSRENISFHRLAGQTDETGFHADMESVRSLIK